MKHVFLFLMIIKSFFCCLNAVDQFNKISLGIGYRYDDLKWKTSALPDSNTITLQKWKNLPIFQLSGELESHFSKQLYFRINGDYGWLGCGTKTYDEIDLDALISVEEEWLIANTRGHVYDVSGAFGYTFLVFQNQLQLSPLIGYACSLQHFEDYNYQDKIHLVNFFEGIESISRYRWQGPWLGINLSYALRANLKTFLEYQFHLSSYRAKITNNLIDDSLEIQTNNCVWGNDLTLGLYYPWRIWELTLTGNYKFYHGNGGKSHIENHVFKLKKISWQSLNFNLNLSCNF